VSVLLNLKCLFPAKSPEFSHLTASVQGLTTIRALQAQERLVDQFDSILVCVSTNLF
jgi:hypothetical protein